MSPDPRRALSALCKVPRVAWRTVALLVAVLAAWVGAGVAGATARLCAPAAVAVAAAAAFASFTVMHDAAHGTIARLRWVNAVAGHLSASILLVRFVAFRQIHRRHHRFTGDPARDPDRWTGLGPRWTLPLRWATADLHYVVEYDKRRCTPREDVAAWVSAAVLIAVVSGLCAAGYFCAVILFWLLPSRIALFALAYSFDYVPHQRPYCAPASQGAQLASFVIRGAGLDTLLLCQNLHLVHHLYPSAPFYRCPRIWGLVREDLLAAGAREVPLFALARPVSVSGAPRALCAPRRACRRAGSIAAS